jgi:hypothetical protein
VTVTDEGGGRVVFRARLGRIVTYPVAVAFVAVLVWLAVVLPSGPAGYGAVDRAFLVGVAVLSGWFLQRLASVRVVVDSSGVTVRNIVRRRRLEWAEVVGVRMTRDDPWAYLDLADGTTLAAMGIQAADGERGLRAAGQLAELVAAHTRTERDD